MKIAILFSGRVDTTIEQYNNIMNHLVGQSNDVDFFISHSKTDEKNIKDFVNLYKPKKIMESDELYFDCSKYKSLSEKAKHHTMCMYLNRKKVCNLLKEYMNENDIHYDIIISGRCDLVFGNNLDINSLMSHIHNNELCIPNPQCDYTGINDQIAIGNYETITTYLQIYDSLFNILESDSLLFHAEQLLAQYLKLENAKIYRFNLNYFIKRYHDRNALYEFNPYATFQMRINK
jgi:hypothetical protein